MEYSLVPKKNSNLRKMLQTFTSIFLWRSKEPAIFENILFYISEIQVIFITLYFQFHCLGNQESDSLTIFMSKLSEYLPIFPHVTTMASKSVLHVVSIFMYGYFIAIVTIFNFVLIGRFKTGKLSAIGHWVSVYWAQIQTWLFGFPLTCYFMFMIVENPSVELFPGLTQENRQSMKFQDEERITES